MEGLLRNSRGPLKSLGHWDIIQFAQGFSQRQPFFDYVDTGKLAIDRKLEGESILISFETMLSGKY